MEYNVKTKIQKHLNCGDFSVAYEFKKR